MSATIGGPETFAYELGLEKKKYEFRAIPNQWPPESRPIHILDVPKMGYKKNESQRDRLARFDKQADAIVDFIRQYPSEWSGLIHVTRKKEEVYLARRLARRGLMNRVWYVPGKTESYVPTDSQLRAWQARLKKVPNSLLVTCSFSEGYDGRDERINISAKIPYPFVGRRGSYDFAWMIHNRKRYDQAAAIRLAQQMGRNRRGRECDYDVPGEPRGANAIADASFGRVLKHMPADIQEAIVE